MLSSPHKEASLISELRHPDCSKAHGSNSGPLTLLSKTVPDSMKGKKAFARKLSLSSITTNAAGPKLKGVLTHLSFTSPTKPLMQPLSSQLRLTLRWLIPNPWSLPPTNKSALEEVRKVICPVLCEMNFNPPSFARILEMEVVVQSVTLFTGKGRVSSMVKKIGWILTMEAELLPSYDECYHIPSTRHEYYCLEL